MTPPLAVLTGIYNVAMAAAAAAGITITGVVRKEPKRKPDDENPFVIASPLDESELPDGQARRQVKRTIIVAYMRPNDGKMQDLTAGSEWRAAVLASVSNLKKVTDAITAIEATSRVVNCEIDSRQPWELGRADMVFDILPVVVTVTTQEGY